MERVEAVVKRISEKRAEEDFKVHKDFSIVSIAAETHSRLALAIFDPRLFGFLSRCH